MACVIFRLYGENKYVKKVNKNDSKLLYTLSVL